MRVVRMIVCCFQQLPAWWLRDIPTFVLFPVVLEVVAAQVEGDRVGVGQADRAAAGKEVRVGFWGS